eukprot:365414-Chlamydomonas_euryale.AAC.4
MIGSGARRRTPLRAAAAFQKSLGSWRGGRPQRRLSPRETSAQADPPPPVATLTRFSMTAANWRCAMLPLVRMVASRQPDSASGCALSLAKSASALERPSLSGSMSCATSVSKLAPPDSAALTSADSMTLDLGTEEARSTAPAGGRDWGLRGGGARRVAARAGCPSPTVVAQPKTQPPATEANAH